MTPSDSLPRTRLARRVLAAFLAAVAVPLVVSGAVGVWIDAKEQREMLAALLQADADGAALRIATQAEPMADDPTRGGSTSADAPGDGSRESGSSRVSLAGTAPQHARLLWIVDGSGRLIAHPDRALVDRAPDLASMLPARNARGLANITGPDGRGAIVAQAAVPGRDWRVFAELPADEAEAPLRRATARAAAFVAGGLALALVFAALLSGRLVRPLRALIHGAGRIGAGHLDHRIAIRSGDELEVLGNAFNQMAERLQASVAELESKVAERTQALAVASQSKSRFLASASHDLRQPMHALNLFVAQLRNERDPAERERLVSRVDSAVANMNELFESLLDISKLDAGVIATAVSEFPLMRILERVETTFGGQAAARGLALRVIPTQAWVRSDPTLLERIVFNLVTNAIRYTKEGGVVVGARREGADGLVIEVVDTGIGIPADKQARIFAEFYQVKADGAPRGEGLGLGLAIVERLCTLLGHRIALVSLPERGSRFRVTVPRAAPQAVPVAPPAPAAVVDPLRGRRVLVIDNDPLVLESTSGLLRSWGCDVVSADSGGGAMAALGDDAPDLVVSDFHLGETDMGSAVIEALRLRFGEDLPAFLVSGDIQEATRESAKAAGLHLLDKPVSPMKLRAMATRLLAARATG